MDYTLLLTSAVTAALLTSIIDLIISLKNNHDLKKIEEKKRINELDKYRYEKLYELILDWDNYQGNLVQTTIEDMLDQIGLNKYSAILRRYQIAKPLLDKCYVEKLEIEKEKLDGELGESISKIDLSALFTRSLPFESMLMELIIKQLESIRDKNNMKRR